jgi:hypothetical protein
VRPNGRFVRIEVERTGGPAPAEITRAIAALPGVALVEALAPDMESTLRSLASAA